MKPRRVLHLPHRPRPRPAAPEPRDEDFVEHPEGGTRTAPEGAQQSGPFDALANARRDRERGSEQAVDEAAVEREAERELGIDDALEEDLPDRRAEDPDAPP